MNISLKLEYLKNIWQIFEVHFWILNEIKLRSSCYEVKSPTEQLTEIMATKVPEFSLVELHKPLTSAGIKDAPNILVLKAICRIANELLNIWQVFTGFKWSFFNLNSLKILIGYVIEPYWKKIGTLVSTLKNPFLGRGFSIFIFLI